jgi:hypothetical protein
LKSPIFRRKAGRLWKSDRISQQLQISGSNRNNSLDVTRMATSSHNFNLGLDEETEDNIFFNVPTRNAFGTLSPNATAAVTPTAAAEEKQQKQGSGKERTKPIYIKNASNVEVIKFMKAIEVKDFNLKLISGGIKLLVQKTDDFKKTKSALLKNNAEFYTYALQDELSYKVVLYGLPPYQPDEVKGFLEEKGLTALEVKKINLKKSRYENETIFIVYLKKGTTTLSELKRNIRSLNYIVVNWAAYRKQNNVTQCGRCLNFGHGANNCNMTQKCLKCGEEHATEKCVYSKQFEEKTKEVKCGNCSQNHTANYHKCPNRISFLEYRQKILERDAAKKRDNRTSYPRKTNNNNNSNNNSKNYSHFCMNNGLVEGMSYSQAVSSPHKSAGGSTNFASNDLFTPEEIMLITNDMFSKLSTCKNKFEQLAVIAQMATKYILNDK